MRAAKAPPWPAGKRTGPDCSAVRLGSQPDPAVAAIWPSPCWPLVVVLLVWWSGLAARRRRPPPAGRPATTCSASGTSRTSSTTGTTSARRSRRGVRQLVRPRTPPTVELKLDRLVRGAAQAERRQRAGHPRRRRGREHPRRRAAPRRAQRSASPTRTLHYQHVLMKDVAAGRHIAPAIITRLPVRGRPDPTARPAAAHPRRARRRQRPRPVVVVASHWTSRVTDETGDRPGQVRRRDLRRLHRACHLSNPDVDFLRLRRLQRHAGRRQRPDAPARRRRPSRRRSDRRAAAVQPHGRQGPADFGTHYYRQAGPSSTRSSSRRGCSTTPAGRCDPDSVAHGQHAGPARATDAPAAWRFGNENGTTRPSAATATTSR